MLYVDVVVDTIENLDKIYEYSVPHEYEQRAVPGAPVNIPFGKGNTSKNGYILSVKAIPEYPPEKIKPLNFISAKGICAESKMIDTAVFIKEHYGGTMFDALRTVIPVKKKMKPVSFRDIYPADNTEITREALNQATRKKHVAKERLLSELLASGKLDYSFAVSEMHVGSATITSLCKAGAIRVEERTEFRIPMLSKADGRKDVVLNPEQREAAEEIIRDYQNGIRKTYYIHGITGSGKTEVYMEAAKRVVEEGKQVIMLIPEISLTYQTVLRFRRKFGDRISVLNSRLSDGERYDQIERARKGEIDIIIGPRSALFTPFSNLGLIIIDEEHESSYKNEGVPKYHAREVAEYIAGISGASVIMCSATPSVEAYTECMKGNYRLFTLTKRAKDAKLPTVKVVDLREELKNKNRSVFSVELKRLIADRLEKHEQIILFLNRRGYAGFVSCRSCGEAVKCPHCDVSLTRHSNNTLVCHYCGYTVPMLPECPKCGSKYLAGFGIGTQKIEELVKKEFPQARVLRMDADTTKSKEGHREILASFANEEADILIGTQMIVKGHDFPKVTLVGILAADMSLLAGDFRAAERTFQILCQASGRAGRGELPGEVVIQTYQPDNYAVTAAAKADYISFYNTEYAARSLVGYPPYVNMLVVLCTAKDEKQAVEGIKKIKERTDELIGRLPAKSVKLIGPASAEIKKLADYYRQVLYVKAQNYDTLVGIKNGIEELFQGKGIHGCVVQFDFNPMNSY